MAVINSQLYAVGGCGGDGSVLDYKHCTALNTVEKYDPKTRTWTVLNPLLTPRHGFATGIFGTQMVIAGGTSAAGLDVTTAQADLTAHVDSYDEVGDAWYSIGVMPDPRDGLMRGYGLVVGTTVYLISGSTADSEYSTNNEQMSLRC